MPKETKPRASKKDTGAKRAKKDPDAPKRSLSSYMLFTQEQRSVVQSENPGVSFGETGKLLGEKWKSLSDADKKPYEDKAKAEKEKYLKAKAAYDDNKA